MVSVVGVSEKEIPVLAKEARSGATGTKRERMGQRATAISGSKSAE
jgi:hypothetical protein